MDKILIIDFGSQYTHLILKVIRKHNVYCEVLDKFPNTQKEWLNVRGVILSGGPDMVDDTLYNIKRIAVPILGICFGAQYIAQSYGCEVKKINSEYGRTLINIDKSFNHDSLIFTGISSQLEVWMSHSNSIVENLSSSQHLHVLSVTENGNIAAFKIRNKDVYGLLFHPEVSHTNKGNIILNNFINICRCKRSWNPKQIVVEIVKNIKRRINNKERVIMAVSGGVDSTVAACLINKAIGKRLSCVFIDNGLLRENEYSEVLARYKKMKLSVVGVDAKELFISRLKGIVDPEEKRKIIGATFIDTFTEHTKSLKNVPKFLGQGTIYSDVIESSKNMKSSRKIKSHHNVGGLPEDLNFKLIEPLRDLFKDEVRIIGRELKIDNYILNRHPFPGPGLAIRIIGDVTKEKINILQKGDKIFTDMLRKNNLYDKIWQAGAILLNTKTVGVMGDERTYEYVLALRAVCSNEGMTANIYPFNMRFLEDVSNKIINNVEGVNRVVYDISSKPPATIEWE